MKTTDLSLKWLEIFVAIARSGSVQEAAQETGISISTASHHLRRLEESLGVQLFDHGRRPLRVPPAGAAFQQHIDTALQLIRRARRRAVVLSISRVPATRSSRFCASKGSISVSRLALKRSLQN